MKFTATREIYIFHGGCHGCTRQWHEEEGTMFCVKCQYFDANWKLPDLNNRPKTDSEIERERIKKELLKTKSQKDVSTMLLKFKKKE